MKLYQKVMLTHELKKQKMIKQLHGYGVMTLDDLTYYELKRLLATLKRLGRMREIKFQANGQIHDLYISLVKAEVIGNIYENPELLEWKE